MVPSLHVGCLGLNGSAEFIFMFVLSLDFVGNDLRYRQREYFGLNRQQKYDPVISVGAILHVPGLTFDIPLMSASNSRSNLFMCQGTTHLLFCDVPAT